MTTRKMSNAFWHTQRWIIAVFCTYHIVNKNISAPYIIRFEGQRIERKISILCTRGKRCDFLRFFSPPELNDSFPQVQVHSIVVERSDVLPLNVLIVGIGSSQVPLPMLNSIYESRILIGRARRTREWSGGYFIPTRIDHILWVFQNILCCMKCSHCKKTRFRVKA